MSKPDENTLARDTYKRQLSLLKGYLLGSLMRLEDRAKKSPADAEACEIAKAELDYLLSTVLPEMRKAE